MIGGAAAPQH